MSPQRTATSRTFLRGKTSASSFRGRARRRASSDANFNSALTERSQGPHIAQAQEARARAVAVEDDDDYREREFANGDESSLQPLTRIASTRSFVSLRDALHKTKSVSSSRVALFHFRLRSKSSVSQIQSQEASVQASEGEREEEVSIPNNTVPIKSSAISIEENKSLAENWSVSARMPRTPPPSLNQRRRQVRWKPWLTMTRIAPRSDQMSIADTLSLALTDSSSALSSTSRQVAHPPGNVPLSQETPVLPHSCRI